MTNAIRASFVAEPVSLLTGGADVRSLAVMSQIANPQAVVERLIAFQARVRDAVRAAHSRKGLHEVAHTTAADTIYAIDTDVEPILIEMCEEWGRETPLVLIAEGVHDEHGVEGPRMFPAGTGEADAKIRLIVDPIDGTRGIMYDKRSAWALAGVALNKGPGTKLSDIEIAVMTELPTSKAGAADVLWAIRGHGAKGVRVDLTSKEQSPLELKPSSADTLRHGFASVVNFFPGTKVLAGELLEYLTEKLLGGADVNKALIFDDQYISTGGQFYELIVGHDRFIADLRAIFYRLQKQQEGLCVHPYDCATWLVAHEAGVILTDGLGNPLDGPLDCTTSLSWAGYANATLRDAIEPLVKEFVRGRNR
jgi:fructose-1,6-bisphosphatase/inositol monophosphatase family enzyme